MPIHTADADATQLSSWVTSASAVCIGLNAALQQSSVNDERNRYITVTILLTVLHKANITSYCVWTTNSRICQSSPTRHDLGQSKLVLILTISWNDTEMSHIVPASGTKHLLVSLSVVLLFHCRNDRWGGHRISTAKCDSLNSTSSTITRRWCQLPSLKAFCTFFRVFMFMFMFCVL